METTLDVVGFGVSLVLSMMLYAMHVIDGTAVGVVSNLGKSYWFCIVNEKLAK